MFVAYTAKNPWYYRVCEAYNGAVSKVLGDKWINLRILSIQSLEAHQCSVTRPWQTGQVHSEVVVG